MKLTTSEWAEKADLTKSEVVIAVMYAHGAPRKTIARERGVAQSTVAKQLRAVFDKLGVNTKGELTAKYFTEVGL